MAISFASEQQTSILEKVRAVPPAVRFWVKAYMWGLYWVTCEWHKALATHRRLFAAYTAYVRGVWLTAKCEKQEVFSLLNILLLWQLHSEVLLLFVWSATKFVLSVFPQNKVPKLLHARPSALKWWVEKVFAHRWATIMFAEQSFLKSHHC